MSASNVLGKGRTALVTGASRGIGPLIAAAIAREGGHVENGHGDARPPLEGPGRRGVPTSSPPGL